MALILGVSLAGSGCAAPKEKKEDAKKEDQKDEKDPLDGKTINLGKGDGTFRDPDTKKALWDLEWESSVVQPGSGSTEGVLRTVRGKLFTENPVPTTFEADGARIDQDQQLLVLKGNVKIISPGNSKGDGSLADVPSSSGKRDLLTIPAGTLTCDQVRYEAKVKGKEIIKARGNVLVKTTQGTIGPTPELWTNPKLTIVATPNMYEEK